MGSSLSCTRCHSSFLRRRRQRQSPAPAMVIAVDGSLWEFPVSSLVSVSDVLGGNAASFVCNSDALYFDEDVPALDGGELLRPGQIHFVLPAVMLGRPLSSADMAALAVRASVVLAGSRPRSGCRGSGKNGRVAPVRVDSEGDDVVVNEKLNERTLGEFGMPPSSAGRAQKPAAAAARSPLRRALSTIEELAE